MTHVKSVIRSGTGKTHEGHKHQQLQASFLGTQMYSRYAEWSDCIPKIPLFDFIPSIIILFGKHNTIGSQKNYTAALLKTNNLLALCLTEQHCQPARNHPF